MTGSPVDESGDLSLFVESTPPLLTVILALNLAVNFDSDIACEPCILRRVEIVLLPRVITGHSALLQACMIAASVGAGTPPHICQCSAAARPDRTHSSYRPRFWFSPAAIYGRDELDCEPKRGARRLISARSRSQREAAE